MREPLTETIGVSILNSLPLSKISSLFLELGDLISVYMSTVKWTSGISVLCLDWRGYEMYENGFVFL